MFKYVLALAIFSGCAERAPLYIDVGSSCNNGIETIRFFDLEEGDPRMNFYTGRIVCDYDEIGRVISEKYYDSINFDAKLTVETTYYWDETRILVEVKDYMNGDYRKDFVSSRRVIDLMWGKKWFVIVVIKKLKESLKYY